MPLNDDATVRAEPDSYGIVPDGYRLPQSTRLGQVRLQVSDLARSTAYYRDVLGFRVAAGDDVHARLGAHGSDVTLVELRERRGAVPAAARGLLGLYHFAILLPDRAALGRLIGHLASIGARAGSADHLVSEALYLRDPDGLGIEVYADRPRSEWQRRGREIVMATDPLDMPDLILAAAGQPWTGIPAGTVVGHVHLHVGDLERAAEFFHGALGLDSVVWSYPGALFLSAGGYHHHLGLNTWAGPSARQPQENDARLLEWEVLVPTQADADAAARSVQAAGYPVTRSDRGWLITDPWGTTLRVTAA